MKIRKWFFKMRGALMVPLAIVVLILGMPVYASFAAGLIIALAGEALRIWGVGYAGKTTRSHEIKAPQLVTAGPFAYVRNPLYLGNAITGLGFIIMACGAVKPWTAATLWILYFLSYSMVYGTIIPVEEEYLKETFSETYIEYFNGVPRIIPRLSPYGNKQGTFSWSPVLSGEMETIIIFILFCAAMILKGWWLQSF